MAKVSKDGQGKTLYFEISVSLVVMQIRAGT
jgi:hypothetical protein